MQAVSPAMTTATNASVRRLAAKALIAFDRTPTGANRYFTVGISSIGSADPIAPGAGATDITEWDKYPYIDFSNRILDMEVTHELDLTGNMIMGMADLTLANTDDVFTPGADVIIGDYAQRPKRPLRLAAGFGVYTCPLFVGLTEKAPSLSESSKTAKFHALDFIKSIAGIKLSESVMYEDARIDEAISDLLISYAGLGVTQFELEPGIRPVPFIYFKKDTTLGDAISQLCQSELATFFEDEAGVLRLWNRNHIAMTLTPVWTFNRDNCREIEYPDARNVINSVEVSGNVREVQANQKLWEMSGAQKLAPGQSIDIFADFKDDYGDLPVTTVDEPEYLATAETSYYATNEAQDGTGAPVLLVSLTSYSKFATGYKMTFTNNNTVTAYITQLELYAKPAKVIKEIYVLRQDTTSINQYDEEQETIENDYIQSEQFASTIATMLIGDRANPSGVREIEVTRGVPQLQTGDLVNFDDGNGNDTYIVQKKITNVGKGGLVQNLTLVKRAVANYFTVGISPVGGPAIIAP